MCRPALGPSSPQVVSLHSRLQMAFGLTSGNREVARTGMLLVYLILSCSNRRKASIAVLKSSALVVATALLSGSVFAQSYPAKPVRIVVPSVAGGTIDQVARLVGPRLTETLGRTFIIDNRPGASGNI